MIVISGFGEGSRDLADLALFAAAKTSAIELLKVRGIAPVDSVLLKSCEFELFFAGAMLTWACNINISEPDLDPGSSPFHSTAENLDPFHWQLPSLSVFSVIKDTFHVLQTHKYHSLAFTFNYMQRFLRLRDWLF